MKGRKCFRRKGRAIAGMIALAACFAILVGVQAARAQTSVPPVYFYLGKWLSASGENFANPAGVAIYEQATNKFVYVADTGNNRILKFNLTDGLLIGSPWTSGPLVGPRGIAVDGSGNVYVADTGSKKVRKYNSSGVLQATEFTNGDTFNPTAVAVDDQGYVYVADTTNNCIRKYNSSGGLPAATWANGPSASPLSGPSGIAFIKTGGKSYLFVADTGNHRVVKFINDGTFPQPPPPTTRAQWGSNGTDDGQFINPLGIAIGGNNVYVADTGNKRIQRFSLNGDYEAKWGPGSDDAQLSSPQGLAVTTDKRIFVCDVVNHRIAIFKEQTATAYAGPDQSVLEWTAAGDKTEVTLSGTNSTPVEQISGYFWEQISGPNVNLGDPTKAEIKFDAPDVGTNGATLNFRLTVTFLTGNQIPDECKVTVTNANAPPKANAGEDQTVAEWTSVTLDGTGSYDPDGDSLTYSWIQTDGPKVTLADATTATPSFTAPDVYKGGAALTFRLTVSDGYLSKTDQCIVNVSWVNIAPVANAGPDQTVEENSEVTLDGSGSYDPDPDPAGDITYYWSLTDSIPPSPPVTLSDPTAAKPTFNAPEVDKTTVLTFTLTVTDVGGLKKSDDCTVTVLNKNTKPDVDAGANVTILSEKRDSTTIKGTATDADGDSLKYRWLKEGSPLSNWQDVAGDYTPLNLVDSLIPLGIGAHTLTLEVDDGYVVVSDTMLLTIDNTPPNAVPSGNGTYEVNAPVTLGGEVSDYDGDLVYYAWIEGEVELYSGQVQPPAGGTPVPLPPHTISTLEVGAHILTLKVYDAANNKTPVTKDITVIIQDTQGPTLAPVANKLILWPPNKAMVDIVIQANASDNSGKPVTLTAKVDCNEPGVMGVDWTEPVIDQAQGTISLKLCADRLGKGTGRWYTITITATDLSTNQTSQPVAIKVPHDQRYQER